MASPGWLGVVGVPTVGVDLFGRLVGSDVAPAGREEVAGVLNGVFPSMVLGSVTGDFVVDVVVVTLVLPVRVEVVPLGTSEVVVVVMVEVEPFAMLEVTLLAVVVGAPQWLSLQHSTRTL